MQMIKKLRIRLVAVSMASLLVVLLSIITTASLLNYWDLVRGADEILELLADNDGSFPDMRQMSESPTPPAKPEGETAPESEGPAPGAPSRGDRGFRQDRMSVELPYESRYFTVQVSADGSAESADLGQIAAIAEEDAFAYAEKAMQRGKTRGFLEDYRFLVRETDSGHLVLFLDRGRNLATFRTFLLTGYGISLAGLLIVFALIAFFSGRITRPFVENYEKQRRFITDAGHELKTPLAIIEADAEVLEMDLGEDNEWLTDIKKQTARLAGLTKNLISLARTEEDGGRLTMIDFPVSEVVEETAESYRAPALAQGKTFRVSVEPLLTLHGDEAAIRQLVGLLLDNALKYSGEDGIISLALARQGKNLMLKISNTAEHISRESLPHLFERFYRADASRNSGTGGYGIGLSIAQAIVQGHKGRITAETADESSLTITATFPGCSPATEMKEE